MRGETALSDDIEMVEMAGSEENTGAEDVDRLREDILGHLQCIGVLGPGGRNDPANSKAAVRAMHAFQRRENLQREWAALERDADRLLTSFANGAEVEPERIHPYLVPVKSEGDSGRLFRLATLLWSVPVSRGYGRRMRFLVMDGHNDKLIGLFALGDPVFNLSARDQWLGWDVHDRRARLVNVMDAYVVGAVPPYAELLGGKLVVSLIGSAEVGQAFADRYGSSCGIISGARKNARLVLVTVTSALGRSSLYNRVKLLRDDQGDSQTLVELKRLGWTRGYGHFQLSHALFERLRAMLAAAGHPYAEGHQYGDGPNWRMRVVRAGLGMLGLDKGLLRHGVAREVYAMELARNCREFLCGREGAPALCRPSVGEIGVAARHRWILPRASRMPDYRSFQRCLLRDQIVADLPDTHPGSPCELSCG